MEAAIAAGSLRAAYQLLVFGIKVDQVPNAVRRCIELVRTCHYDLDDLIRLRNEALPLLESKPAILDRINTIIERARASLFEIARLVEKLRPEAHEGNTSFVRRLEWLFVSSRDFRIQEPLISRQHSSVIAELNFLRQLILLAPVVDSPKPGGGPVVARTDARPTVAWENVALLDEMLGGGNKQTSRPTGRLSTGSLEPVSSRVSQTPSIGNPSASVTELPPPYAPPTPEFTNKPWPSSEIASAPGPFVYHASVPDVHKTSIFPTGQPAVVSERKGPISATGGPPSLYGDLKLDPFPEQSPNIGSHKPEQHVPWKIKTQTTFDSTGAACLFGDHGELSPIPRPLTPNWNFGGDGRQSRRDSNVLSLPRMPSPTGSTFPGYLDGSNPQLQPSATPSVSHHQMAPALPFSTTPQHLLNHRQDGVDERPRSSPSTNWQLIPELPTDNQDALSRSINPPAEVPAEPPPPDGTVVSARCSVASKSATRLPFLDSPGSQDPTAVAPAAYATPRGHRNKPQYLTRKPVGARGRESNNTACGNDSTGGPGSLIGPGVQSVSSGQTGMVGPFPNDLDNRGRDTGNIAELSAVVFPLEPSELES